jgi:glycyl-tRNA synthetase beta chain
MKGEVLLEIGTEEIPAGFILPALKSFSELFAAALDNARIGHGQVTTYATPRRMILHAIDVDSVQASKEIEKTGPAVSAAFDADGKPTKAAIGFARSQGIEVSELVVVSTPKGDQVAVRKTETGQPTAQVLANIIPGLMEKIPFPKTMRWMDLDVRFARPVHWIAALFEGKVIPFKFGSVESGNRSRGHRFTNPKPFAVKSLKGLKEGLQTRDVTIESDRRRELIAQRTAQLAADQGLRVFEDAELLDEVTNIVESPHPIMGEFSKEFLELPASILITCMKKHQRYFSVQDDQGRITNRFIAVNNTPVKDPAVSVKGHERVLKARLEDARFYFREDRKIPLIERLQALEGVVFHSKLGTASEKVERFTFLAKKLAERFAPDKVDDVERASLLSKCDLETGIVYEFPELQGIIGSYYAKLDGEKQEVSTAIREHYLPAFAGDKLPQGIMGSLVSIADRIDTIAGCFSVGLIPTGAADPYALRRHALAIIQILMQLDQPVDLDWLVRLAVSLLAQKRVRDEDQVIADVTEFIRTRFVNFHTSRDFPLDVVEAAARARFDDIVDARRRVEALNVWKQRTDFDAIMIGFKRVVNILKDTAPTAFDPKLLEEDAEKALFEAFHDVSARSKPLIQEGNYAQALEIIAELKSPVDTLFDKVMVMVEDEKLRNNRLGLLRQIADFFAQIADFSFIGSTAQGK